jgi:hypothetical protein
MLPLCSIIKPFFRSVMRLAMVRQAHQSRLMPELDTRPPIARERLFFARLITNSLLLPSALRGLPVKGKIFSLNCLTFDPVL